MENFRWGGSATKWGYPKKSPANLKIRKRLDIPQDGARQTRSLSWQEMTGRRWWVPEVPGAPEVSGTGEYLWDTKLYLKCKKCGPCMLKFSPKYGQWPLEVDCI